MTSRRLHAAAAAAVLAAAGMSSSAAAASFNGYWSLTARTTNGHCGVTQWNVAISDGQFHIPGSYYLMGYPVNLAGAVSPAGQAQVHVTAGPRFASGVGRFAKSRGNGKWAGQGPSGTCSGVWTATRLQTPIVSAPSWTTTWSPSWGAAYAAPVAFRAAPSR